MSKLSIVSTKFVYATHTNAIEEILFNDGMKLVFKRHNDFWDAEYAFTLRDSSGHCVARYNIDGASNVITRSYAVRRAKTLFGANAKYVELASL